MITAIALAVAFVGSVLTVLVAMKAGIYYNLIPGWLRNNQHTKSVMGKYALQLIGAVALTITAAFFAGVWL